MALPSARAIRSYCTGLSHEPVSASIPNAEWATLEGIKVAVIVQDRREDR
ncbi:MAG: hypothetical protein ABIN91_19780 [Mucilaginibacter sp.]